MRHLELRLSKKLETDSRGNNYSSKPIIVYLSEQLPVRAMHCYREGIRSRGAQPKRWIDGTEEDLTSGKRWICRQ